MTVPRFVPWSESRRATEDTLRTSFNLLSSARVVAEQELRVARASLATRVWALRTRLRHRYERQTAERRGAEEAVVRAAYLVAHQRAIADAQEACLELCLEIAKRICIAEYAENGAVLAARIRAEIASSHPSSFTVEAAVEEFEALRQALQQWGVAISVVPGPWQRGDLALVVPEGRILLEWREEFDELASLLRRELLESLPPAPGGPAGDPS